MNDYSIKITCPVSAEGAYAAITQKISEWWTPMNAQFLKVGDGAKTGFGGRSYWVFEAKTLNEPYQVELECIESQIIMDSPEDPEEWLGTTLRFDFSETENGTKIIFTHIAEHQRCNATMSAKAAGNITSLAA